jgi:hypothetical protein
VYIICSYVIGEFAVGIIVAKGVRMPRELIGFSSIRWRCRVLAGSTLRAAINLCVELFGRSMH